MIATRHQFITKLRSIPVGVVAVMLTILLGWSFFFAPGSEAQSVSVINSSSIFRIGEKLTYTISFGKLPNAGYAETHVVSRGKISGKDAVEIRSKVKTIDLFSAAFFRFDESRTTFAAPDTGLPLYITSNNHDTALPKETVTNYLAQPTSNFDLVTLVYKVRESGGLGTFPLFEGEQLYTASFLGAATEKVKTEAGEFDTTVSTVQSDFLTVNGIKEFKINFTADEYRVPVLIRFKMAKGEFRVMLSAITLPEVETPSPTPTPTPSGPKASPTPSPTPPSYVENQPLLEELGFQIGEKLDYQITTGGKPVGVLTLNARERKLFEKLDSLLLTATVTSVEAGSTALRLGDAANVQVDPDTLTPTRIESKFASSLIGLNQTVSFNKRTGMISFGGKQPIDAPIGTHTFVSLIYAMRSFNLKPSKNLSNPVNDTRVAVFWESKSYVFTLRPSNPTEITLNGEKVSAQMITVKTDNKELDALALKVWLGTDSRVPLRFSAGTYQADLISQSSNFSK
jgi:hypothetical protein